MQYYLPTGTWENLLTGDTAEGNCWQKEKHGFMTLPLMVRPGTVLPLGKCDTRPDYDYADGVELHVYHLTEGATAVCRIPALDGSIAATYTVTMVNGKPRVETDATKPYTVVVHA